MTMHETATPCAPEDLDDILSVLRCVDDGAITPVPVDPPVSLEGFRGRLQYRLDEWTVEVFIDGGDFATVEAWRGPDGRILTIPPWTIDVGEQSFKVRMWRPKHPRQWGLGMPPPPKGRCDFLARALRKIRGKVT